MGAPGVIGRSVLLLLMLGGALFAIPPSVAAPEQGSSAPSPTQKQIEEKNQEIRRLEEEVAQYRATLGEIGKEASTLESQVKAIDRAIALLGTRIKITDTKIGRTNLEISVLAATIAGKELSIATQRERLGYLIGIVAERERETPLEIFFKNESVANFFVSIDRILGVQRDLRTLLLELRATREDLKRQKTDAETKRLELAALSAELADQRSLQEHQRSDRQNLLRETRNQERRYQELLAEVERKRDALQQEINALEAGLKPDFDPAQLPETGPGVLGWPLADLSLRSCFSGIAAALNCVTQFFGRTDFSRAGGYSGKGHNGVDFRASVGTPVYASERGSVRATGDTDARCRRASYGRWILIDHPNNLATLYTHLSLVKVAAGDALNRGELIGYSGRTGYATGPHLHFGVFAREAVAVGELKSRVCGRNMTLPLSPFGGYLDPLSYL